jgi:hypothetical protein
MMRRESKSRSIEPRHYRVDCPMPPGRGPLTSYEAAANAAAATTSEVCQSTSDVSRCSKLNGVWVYSISSSARVSSDGGTVIPSALAVLN